MNKFTILYLVLAACCFITAIVLIAGVSEAYQASAWLLFFTLLCCSSAYTRSYPRLKNNYVVVAVGIIFVICTGLSMCAFAAGLATRTLDRTAFGFGVFVTLCGLPLTLLWTKSGLASQSDETQLATKGEELKHRGGCCETKACLYCASILWVLMAILVVIFTAEVIGEVADARKYMPVDAEFAAVPADASQTFNSSLREMTGRDDPRIRMAHERHMVCNGTGSPLVILEHGRGGSIWDWAWVQRLVADNVNGTRVCAFSRSGYGYSSRGDRPRSAAQASLELKASLRSLGIDVPFVHVGHSWGGMSMRMYQKMYPDQIITQVFVDAVHAPCMELCEAGKPTPSSIYRLFSLLGGSGIPRALAASGALPLNGSALLAALPQEARGPRLATIVSPQFWQTWTDENEELSLSCDQVKRLANANVTTFKVPVRNVLAGEGIYFAANNNYTCGRGLQDISSPPGTTVIVNGAPHIELLFDLQFAAIVAEQVLDVVQQVRLA